MANVTTDYSLYFTDGNANSKIIQNFTDDTANRKLIISGTDSMVLLGDRLSGLSSSDSAISWMRRVSDADVEIASFRADKTFVLESSDILFDDGNFAGLVLDGDAATPGKELLYQNGTEMAIRVNEVNVFTITFPDFEFNKSVKAHDRVNASAEGFCTRAQSSASSYTGTPTDGAVAIQTGSGSDRWFYAYANGAWRRVALTAA